MGDDANWAISNELHRYICEILPAGSWILELGSGAGTRKLAENYSMISVEHDPKFLNLHHTRYIHAPIQPFRKQCGVFPSDKGWYDRDVLRQVLPMLKYDLILVDGPPNYIGRGGFFKWRDLFNLNVPIIIDDLQRVRETKLAIRMSAHLKRPYTVHGAWTPKHFGVILP